MPRARPLGPLLGARKLRAFLTEEKTSVPAFCVRNGLDRFKVQRVLNGHQRKVDVDFAFVVEQATMRNGVSVVRWFDWLPSATEDVALQAA